MQEGREGVGELENAGCADDGGEASEIGDRGADYEGDGPVEGDYAHPNKFASALIEGRCA